MNSTVSDMYFGTDRCTTVMTQDGIPLVVSEVGSLDSSTTVIFAHGFTTNISTWQCQRELLSAMFGDDIRMVFYDHRGHGFSGLCSYRTSTVEQLGADLGTVIEEIAPYGDVVLVGHSMGGMTIMSYARQNPSQIGTRVKGVALLATSSGSLPRSGLPLLLNGPLIDGLRLAQKSAPSLANATLWAAKGLQAPVIQNILLGKQADTTSRIVNYLEDMFMRNDLGTVLNFLHALKIHDESDALPVLAKIPSLVLCGDQDHLLPSKHSDRIAAMLPRCDYQTIRGAGHMLMMEQPLVVADAIAGLVRLSQTATIEPHLKQVL